MTDMKGKILEEKYYQIQLPYPGYWPDVHEIRYVPTAEEAGKSLNLWTLTNCWWRQSHPSMLKAADASVVEVESRTKNQHFSIPLKHILALEDCYFGIRGPEGYERNPGAGCRVVHLMIDQDGETVGHYLFLDRTDRVVYTQNITFGDDREMGTHGRLDQDIPHWGLIDVTNHPDAMPAPATEMSARRQLTDEMLLEQYAEMMDRVKKRPAVWNTLIERGEISMNKIIKEILHVNPKPGEILLVKLGDPATGWIPSPEMEKRILELLTQAELNVPAVIWNYGIQVEAIGAEQPKT